jgi:hypothetical protein
MDIALVNLWKYLESEGATQYNYYEHDTKKTDNMLDLVHDKEDFQDPREGDNEDLTPGEEVDTPDISFDALGGKDKYKQEDNQKPKRKIRIAKPQ